MKLCMVSRNYPPNIGGCGSFLEVLSKELVNDGFKVKIITQGSKTKNEYKDGVEIQRLKSIGANEYSTLNMGLNSLMFAKEILKQKDCDLFHMHDLSVAGLGGLLAKPFMKNKTFILKFCGSLAYEYLALNGVSDFNYKNNLDNTFSYRKGMGRVLNKIEDMYFDSYDYICPSSEYGAEFLLDRGEAWAKLNVLENGVDTNKFKPSNKKLLKKKLGLKGIVVFTASRFVVWKGIDVLIKAVAQAIKVNDKINLVIAGDGVELKNLINLVKELKIGNHVSFVGQLSRDQMIEYHNASDIFALPSYFESTPNVLLESMACGTAVIANDIKGIREVVNKYSCVLVEPDDVYNLAGRIVAFAGSESLRIKLGKEAVKIINKKYSEKHAIKRYLDFYKNVIGE